MRYEIKLPDAEYRQLQDALWARTGIESAAFMLAGVRRTATAVTLLVRRLVVIPETEYDVRSSCRIELSTRAINGLAALCEANGLIAVVAHSHPTNTSYSPSDDYGEARIASSLWPFVPDRILGSLLFTPDRVHGRIWTAQSKVPAALDKLSIVGRTISTIDLVARKRSVPDSVLAHQPRQILAFGSAGQEAITTMKVGVVGAGGTGSSVCEQLVRLGVKELILVDYDELEASNISRVYGSRYRDANRWTWLPKKFRMLKKVNVVAKSLRAIAPDAKIEPVVGSVTERAVAKRLLDRDVLFACTDDHWGRSVLNQIAYQYLIPCLNVGIALKRDDGAIVDGVGNVQVLRPDTGCLWCGNYLSSDRIRAEALPKHESLPLLKEGYLDDINEQAPSVVSLTTTVASLAVTWFIQLATDFAGSGASFSRQNYNFLTGEVRRGRIDPASDCVCGLVRGRGDLEPLPL